MQKSEWLFILAVLASSACGGRSELDGLVTRADVGGLISIGGTTSTGGWQATGGLSSVAGTVATGASPSTGGSTNTSATTCPSTFPRVSDPCKPEGLYCKYDNAMCLIAYQCSASGQFEWAGDCSFVGGASSLGGTTATGGSSSSTGGTSPTGGATGLGGTNSPGGSTGSGCTGNFEEVQSNSGLCVAKMVTIAGPTRKLRLQHRRDRGNPRSIRCVGGHKPNFAGGQRSQLCMAWNISRTVQERPLYRRERRPSPSSFRKLV